MSFNIPLIKNPLSAITEPLLLSKLLCELPSRSVVTENQSKAMRDFEDVRVILDCTEIFVQNPSKLDARKQVYSNYKHHNTFKFLVGVSPQMGITYVSRMYGGRASDKFITSDSHLQNPSWLLIDFLSQQI
jgi:hypothetical protein